MWSVWYHPLGAAIRKTWGSTADVFVCLLVWRGTMLGIVHRSLGKATFWTCHSVVTVTITVSVVVASRCRRLESPCVGVFQCQRQKSRPPPPLHSTPLLLVRKMGRDRLSYTYKWLANNEIAGSPPTKAIVVIVFPPSESWLVVWLLRVSICCCHR